MKQTLAELKGEIDTSIKIVGDFSTLFSIIGIITRQDTKKETEDLNNTTDQLDLTDIHRVCHPTIAKDTFS